MSHQGLKAPRGTKDIFAPEYKLWQEIEQAVVSVAASFVYDEIRTPIFEQSSLFKRSVGEETDIVAKEMYLFTDKSGDEFALRPELTAGVVRAALENNLITGQAPLAKLYYNSAPMFRYERPQMGRFRQFHQFGTELIGASGPQADCETIHFAISVFQKLGLSNFQVKINSLASREARDGWKVLLQNYLNANLQKLSEDSRRRTESNPMRVLDSKDEADREVVRQAPLLLDHLSPDDKSHFEAVQACLKAIGISYDIDPYLVRGLDYYTRTVFEITSSDLGSQDALCGGGRYDHLIEQLGGASVPAVGFAAGVERLVIALQKRSRSSPSLSPIKTYIVALSDSERQEAFSLAAKLRAMDFPVIFDLQSRSMKAQMREANREEARFVIILRDEDSSNGSVQIRDMSTGAQSVIPMDQLSEILRSRENAGQHPVPFNSVHSEMKEVN